MVTLDSDLLQLLDAAQIRLDAEADRLTVKLTSCLMEDEKRKEVYNIRHKIWQAATDLRTLTRLG